MGNINSEWSGASDAFGRYSLGAGLDRAIEGWAACAWFRGLRHGICGRDFVHNFTSETQYRPPTSSVWRGLWGRFSLGGYNISESALIVEVEGKQSAGQFEVLVDDAPMATVVAGKRVTIFLQPYRRYAVRLLALWLPPPFTMMPGLARSPSFRETSTGRLGKRSKRLRCLASLSTRGVPITNGLLHGDHGTGYSDANGYFQIDVAANDRVTLNVARAAGLSAMPKIEPRKGYSAAGKVMCR